MTSLPLIGGALGVNRVTLRPAYQFKEPFVRRVRAVVLLSIKAARAPPPVHFGGARILGPVHSLPFSQI
jgi:hypothetical protein